MADRKYVNQAYDETPLRNVIIFLAKLNLVIKIKYFEIRICNKFSIKIQWKGKNLKENFFFRENYAVKIVAPALSATSIKTLEL